MEIDWGQVTDLAQTVAIGVMLVTAHFQQKQIELWQKRTDMLRVLLTDVLVKLEMIPDELKGGDG